MKRMVSFRDVIGVLEKHRTQYRWLDIFASNVRELVERNPDLRYRQHGVHSFHVDVGEHTLELTYLTGKDIVRFSLVERELGGPAVGAVMGASLGAAIVANATRRDNTPEGIIFGLLIGGLAGMLIGEHTAVVQGPPDLNRIMTLYYDTQAHDWRVYHGPYQSWAKEALS